MKYKSFAAQVEQKDGGRIRAYASTFDRVPDCYSDVIAPNAFDKTIARWKSLGKPIPILWGHDTEDPFSNIGSAWDFGTDERGFWFEAEFDADNEKAQYVRKLLKEQRVFQCSFAYSIYDEGPVELEDGTAANELREVDIYEISIVQIPANQFATVEDVKSAPVEALAAIAETLGKSGRRNSKKDADELRAIAEYAASIESIVNGLLGKEHHLVGLARGRRDRPRQIHAVLRQNVALLVLMSAIASLESSHRRKYCSCLVALSFRRAADAPRLGHRHRLVPADVTPFPFILTLQDSHVGLFTPGSPLSAFSSPKEDA